MGCGDSIGAIPQATYRALEKALTAKSKAERDLKLYTNLVRSLSVASLRHILSGS